MSFLNNVHFLRLTDEFYKTNADKMTNNETKMKKMEIRGQTNNFQISKLVRRYNCCWSLTILMKHIGKDSLVLQESRNMATVIA